MSEDVLGKLKGLCSELQARIEATTDYKTLVAVERALKDIEALTAVAGASAAEVAVEAAPAAETEVATDAHEDAKQDTVAGAGTEAAGEASDVSADREETAVIAGSSATAESVDATPMDAADEAQAAETAADIATDAVIAEIPAEDRALVAELIATAGDATTVTHGTTAP